MVSVRRPRVLLGNLGPIMRMGMRRVLTERGCEVVGQEERPSEIVSEAQRLGPDLVVLDLDAGAARQLGAIVAGASPETTIVLWAREEDAMEVIDPASPGSRRLCAAAVQCLREQLSPDRVQA